MAFCSLKSQLHFNTCEMRSIVTPQLPTLAERKIKMKKVIVLFAVLTGLASVQAVPISFNRLVKNLNASISYSVEGPSTTGVYYKGRVLDGVVDGNSYLRWLGKLNSNSQDLEKFNVGDSAYLSFVIKYSDTKYDTTFTRGFRVLGYRLYRTTGANDWKEIVPLAWEMWGVTADGVTNRISQIDVSGNNPWNLNDNSQKKADSYVVDISNDTTKYVRLIWVPTKNNGSTATWNIGLNELEIYVEDPSDGMPGFSLAERMHMDAISVADHVSGGMENEQYLVNDTTNGVPVNAFDGTYRKLDWHSDASGMRWKDAPYWVGSTAKGAYLQIDVPESAYPDGICPVGYRISRLATGEERIALAPTAWKFYGETKSNETNLLNEVTTQRNLTWGAYGGAATADNPQRYASTEIDNTNQTKYVSFIWKPSASAVTGSREWDVAVSEFEVFVDDTAYPESVNVRRLMVDNDLNVGDYVKSVNHLTTSYWAGNVQIWKSLTGVYAFDGLTSMDKEGLTPENEIGDYARWTATTNKSSVAIAVPEALYPHGARLNYYRVHRQSCGYNYNERAPLAWEVLGVQRGGKTTNVVSAVTVDAGVEWKTLQGGASDYDNGDNRKYGKTSLSDPGYCTVTNLESVAAETRYVEFIFRPLKTGYDGSNNFGLMELEYFVDPSQFDYTGTLLIVR